MSRSSYAPAVFGGLGVLAVYEIGLDKILAYSGLVAIAFVLFVVLGVIGLIMDHFSEPSPAQHRRQMKATRRSIETLEREVKERKRLEKYAPETYAERMSRLDSRR